MSPNFRKSCRCFHFALLTNHPTNNGSLTVLAKALREAWVCTSVLQSGSLFYTWETSHLFPAILPLLSNKQWAPPLSGTPWSQRGCERASLPAQILRKAPGPSLFLRSHGDTAESRRTFWWILSERKEERGRLSFVLYTAFCNQVAQAGIGIFRKETQRKLHWGFSQMARAVPLLPF